MGDEENISDEEHTLSESLSEEENQAEQLKDVLKATIELNNIIVTLKNNLENLNKEIIKLTSNIINFDYVVNKNNTV